MKIGAMRHRISFYARSMTKDSYGQEIETFALSVTRWGSIEVVSGEKEEGYEGQQQKVTIEITMRPEKTLQVLGRLTALGGKTYSITSIIDVEGLGVEYRVTAEHLQ